MLLIASHHHFNDDWIETNCTIENQLFSLISENEQNRFEFTSGNGDTKMEVF